MSLRASVRAVVVPVLGLACLLNTGAALAETLAYVDREIEGLAPEPVLAERDEAYNPDGWPRFLRVDTKVGTQSLDPDRKTRLGYSLFGLIETPNHGILSVDGSITPGAGLSTLTLRQRDLPMDGGWLVSNELGVIEPPTPTILSLPSRVFVPSPAIRGASTDWRRPDNRFQLMASSGQPGFLDVLPAEGFSRLPGTRTRVGGQWRLGPPPVDPLSLRLPGLSLAFKAEEARGVSQGGNFGLSGRLVDAGSQLAAVRHEAGKRRIQGQWLQSRSSAGQAQGLWVDAELDDGPWRHAAGAYRLDPGLAWAETPVASNLQGVYARSAWRSRQVSVDGSLDLLGNITGNSNRGYFVTSNARWRLSSTDSLGAGAALRDLNGQDWSHYLDWRSRNRWGPAGARLEVAGGDNQAARQQITYDQEWPVPLGWQFGSSLGLGRQDVNDGTTTTGERFWTLALSGSAPLTRFSSARGNLQTERSSSGQERHSLNLGGSWRLSTRWSLEGYYNRNIGRSRQVLVLDPLAPPPDPLTTVADRSFFVLLRYETTAGSRDVPLGGKPNEGGGTVRGTVFFDANRSGVQEASEPGVPGATVFLDNRYSVRTDDQGRFEFPFVGPGARAVTVRNDTLPLPWTVVDDGQIRFDLRVRETTTLSFPVQRSD